MIKCMICSKELKQITRNHLFRHQISIVEYKTTYPSAPLQDDSIKLIGEQNPFYGHKHTIEVKQRMRNLFLGKKNPKTGKKISELWKDQNGVFRKMMASEEYREKMSAVTKTYWESNNSDNHREKNRENLRKYRPLYETKIRDVQNTPKFRKQLSERLKNEWALMSQAKKNARIQKQTQTMMRNGTLSSLGELKFYELLKSVYPNTKHGKWLHKTLTGCTSTWNIDFYIPEIDTYVQFDGVYWHGLDRPIEVIKSSQSPRCKSIYKKWLIDKEQDEWFKKINYRLVRITDIKFNEDPDSCLKEVMLNK